MLRQVTVAATLLLIATPAAAQVRQFTVGPRVGYIKYETETGLDEAAMLGLDAVFSVTRNIGIGFRLDVARPRTDGSFFPAEMTFGDSTLLFEVAQPVTVLQYGGKIELSTGGSFGLFATGSIGGVRITLDPQVVAGRENATYLGYGIGGGINLRTSAGTSLRLEVHDFIFQDFDRSDLNPVQPRFQPQRFPDVIPPQPPFQGTAHNIHLALAFSFTPGGSR